MFASPNMRLIHPHGWTLGPQACRCFRQASSLGNQGRQKRGTTWFLDVWFFINWTARVATGLVESSIVLECCRCTLRVYIVSSYSLSCSDYRLSSTLIPITVQVKIMITMVATMILVCMTTTLQINSGLQEEINRKMANNSDGIWVFKAPHLVPSTVRIGKPARMTAAEDPPALKNQEDLDSFSRHALRSIQKVLHWGDQLRTGMLPGGWLSMENIKSRRARRRARKCRRRVSWQIEKGSTWTMSLNKCPMCI